MGVIEGASRRLDYGSYGSQFARTVLRNAA